MATATDKKLLALEQKFNEVATKQEERLRTLESKCVRYEEEIERLTSVISKQQKTLNIMDAEEHQKNIIITGLSEEQLEDGVKIFDNDEDKIAFIFKALGLIFPRSSTVTRMGRQRQGSHRAIKMNVSSKDVRDTIMRNARRLKGLPPPWDNIYINKDLSPVLVHENKRLREKKKRLSSSDENKDKDVRIEKGKLKVDDEVVDQSIFLD